ncbi:hypothetical protein J4401_06740, partial [Candidatus Woesearchaeota archaeon]|nr:hypothetical protein [Candidatus Woesearchaeota archaeon]
MTNGELNAKYIELCSNQSAILSVSHVIEGFTLTTEEKILSLVNSNVKDKNKRSLLVSPIYPSFLSIEHAELMKIAKQVIEKGQRIVNRSFLKNNPVIKEMIDAHQEKYFWKRNGYSSPKVLSAADFADEINFILQKVTDIDRKLKEFNEISFVCGKKEEILKKINNSELSELVHINDTIFRLHDHRKEMLTIAIHYIDIMLVEIGRRKNIPIELMRYTWKNDFPAMKLGKNELEDRMKKSVFITLPGKRMVYTGDKATEIISKLVSRDENTDSSIIKGNCASGGTATGIVKVCRGEKEIAKVKEGDILVACMTQPEFVPAMKKAAAVITDEGGLT